MVLISQTEPQGRPQRLKQNLKPDPVVSEPLRTESEKFHQGHMVHLWSGIQNRPVAGSGSDGSEDNFLDKNTWKKPDPGNTGVR